LGWNPNALQTKAKRKRANSPQGFEASDGSNQLWILNKQSKGSSPFATVLRYPPKHRTAAQTRTLTGSAQHPRRNLFASALGFLYNQEK